MKRLLACIALVGCRDAYDISKPIDLVTSGTWTDAQRTDLTNAAACWVIGFGVDLRVGSTSDFQRDTLEFDELMCLNSTAWAWTASSFESKTIICPFDLPPNAEPGELFGVLTHELGHVVGIPQEVDDGRSIMGGVEPINIERESGYHIFSPIDHQLFDDNNPDFVQHATCDPVISQNSDASWGCACAPM